MDIILYLLQLIQYQHKQICWLLNFICRYIPLKQWAFDDSHSPKYQKFKIDQLPKIIYYEIWDYKDYIPYLEWKYGKKIKPVSRRSECDIDDNCPVHVAMLQSLISTRIMVPKGRFCAKYAPPHSLRKKTVFQSPILSNVLTAIIRWFTSKTANTLLSTNA